MRSSKFSRVFLAASIGLLVVGLLELSGRILRAYYQDPEQFLLPHERLGHFQKPNYRGWYSSIAVRTNAEGFRGEEFAVQKPSDELRVLSLGDSRTFGVGVPEGETYPARMERLLRSRLHGRSVRVINGGVPGYTSDLAVTLLELKGLGYSPDVVTVAFGHNDRWLTERRGGRRPARPSELTPLRTAIRKSGMFTLAKYLDDSLDSVLEKSLGITVYDGFKKGLAGIAGWLFVKRARGIRSADDVVLEPTVSPEEYRKNLVRIAQIARANRISVIYLNLPENPANFSYAESGRQLLKQKDFKEAERALRKATALNLYFSPASHYYLGLLLREAGRLAEAEHEFILAEFGAKFFPIPNIEKTWRRWQTLGIQFQRRMSLEELGRHPAVVDPRHLIEQYRLATLQASRETGFPVLDLPEAEMDEGKFIPGDIDHPSAEGHRVIAERLVSLLMKGEFARHARF